MLMVLYFTADVVLHMETAGIIVKKYNYFFPSGHVNESCNLIGS